MTTLAYRDGVFAADSLVWDEDTCVGRVKKIHRADSGELWGIAGQLQYLEAAKTWMQGKVGDPPDMKDTYLVVIGSDGVVRVWEGSGWTMIEAPFHAWGTGSQIALGAMAAGANAKAAVSIAADFDCFTGGEIYALDLVQKPEDEPDDESPPLGDRFYRTVDNLDDVIEQETWRRKMGFE